MVEGGNLVFRLCILNQVLFWQTPWVLAPRYGSMKGVLLLVPGEEPWEAPLLWWTILSHCNICQYVLGSKLPWIDKLLANIYAKYRAFVCEITSKKQAIIFSGFALSYLLSIYAKCYPWKKAPWIQRKPLIVGALSMAPCLTHLKLNIFM